MKPKVYIETSIPSFYYEVRTEPDMVARRQWTQQWWEEAQESYELISSVAVLTELNVGDYPNKDLAISLVRGLPLVDVDPEVANIVRTYIQHKVMPSNPNGDALHLALASFHRCDFLLTWNCKHLANANKFGHIRRLNVMLGLYVPMLVTPMELLGDKYD